MVRINLCSEFQFTVDCEFHIFTDSYIFQYVLYVKRVELYLMIFLSVFFFI